MSYRHYPRRAWSCSAWCSEDNIDSSQGGSWRNISLRPKVGLSPQTTRMMQQLFQFFLSDKLVQMIPQAPTIFCGMPMILMILAIEVTVSLFGISHHLIGPFEEGFIFYFFLILDAPAFRRLHWRLGCCCWFFLRNPFSAGCCCIGPTWNPSFPER